MQASFAKRCIGRAIGEWARAAPLLRRFNAVEVAPVMLWSSIASRELEQVKLPQWDILARIAEAIDARARSNEKERLTDP